MGGSDALTMSQRRLPAPLERNGPKRKDSSNGRMHKHKRRARWKEEASSEVCPHMSTPTCYPMSKRWRVVVGAFSWGRKKRQQQAGDWRGGTGYRGWHGDRDVVVLSAYGPPQARP